MDLKKAINLQALLFTLLLEFAASAIFISDGVLQSQGFSIGRNLLQTKKSCNVPFEFANYTIITGRCKAPDYPAVECCPAFKDFACPYADELNDSSNDCATIMNTYITIIGKYPPSLFGDECREDKTKGLRCPGDAPAGNSKEDANAGHVNRSFFLLPTLVQGFLLGIFLSYL